MRVVNSLFHGLAKDKDLLLHFLVFAVFLTKLKTLIVVGNLYLTFITIFEVTHYRQL